jgi:RecJ-like exonuclease
MSLLVGSKIDEVDHAIDALLEQRRQCTDPLDVLLASESIDRLLDDRLQLMRAQEAE